jgi:hypothetical protein
LIEDLFWKSLYRSFSSIFAEVFFKLSQEILLEALIKSVLKKHLLGQDFRTGPGKTLRLSQDEIVLQCRVENVPGADPNTCDLGPFIGRYNHGHIWRE